MTDASAKATLCNVFQSHWRVWQLSSRDASAYSRRSVITLYTHRHLDHVGHSKADSRNDPRVIGAPGVYGRTVHQIDVV